MDSKWKYVRVPQPVLILRWLDRKGGVAGRATSNGDWIAYCGWLVARWVGNKVCFYEKGPRTDDPAREGWRRMRDLVLRMSAQLKGGMSLGVVDMSIRYEEKGN